jgi:hypothetical protein
MTNEVKQQLQETIIKFNSICDKISRHFGFENPTTIYFYKKIQSYIDLCYEDCKHLQYFDNYFFTQLEKKVNNIIKKGDL